MWEYRIEYVALIPPEDVGGNIHKRLSDGKEWWQKELAEILDGFGTRGWEVISIPERLIEGSGMDGYVLLKRQKRLE